MHDTSVYTFSIVIYESNNYLRVSYKTLFSYIVKILRKQGDEELQNNSKSPT